MFNFLKKMRNKDNTPKKGYDLSYDNLAIPEIHIKGNADAKPGGSDNKVNGQQAEGADGTCKHECRSFSYQTGNGK